MSEYFCLECVKGYVLDGIFDEDAHVECPSCGEKLDLIRTATEPEYFGDDCESISVDFKVVILLDKEDETDQAVT